MSSLNRVGLALRGVPGVDVFVALSEGDVAETEPKEKAADGEPVLGRDQEGVHNQKASQEVHAQKKLRIAEASKLTMAIKNVRNLLIKEQFKNPYSQ